MCLKMLWVKLGLGLEIGLVTCIHFCIIFTLFVTYALIVDFVHSAYTHFITAVLYLHYVM